MSSRIYCLAVLSLSFVLSGCSQVSSESADTSAASATPAVFNTAGAPTVEFSVPDMMCEAACGAATREILAAQDGVKEVKIDFAAKTAVVAIDEAKFSPQKALEELVDRGFDQSALKN